MCTKLQSCNKTDDWNLNLELEYLHWLQLGQYHILQCRVQEKLYATFYFYLYLYLYCDLGYSRPHVSSCYNVQFFQTKWHKKKGADKESQRMCLTLVWIKSFIDKIKSLLITVLQIRKLPCSLLPLYFEILRSIFSGIYSFKCTEVCTK